MANKTMHHAVIGSDTYEIVDEQGRAKAATNTQDITALKEDITPMQTATASDVGKALKAKTVEDGKVTAWEFGDTGATTDIHVEGTSLVINTSVADGNEVSF